MVRRYEEPVEVRRGGSAGPEQFLWRGRLWKVRDVVARWGGTGVTDAPPVPEELSTAREVWRVVAGGPGDAGLGGGHGSRPSWSVFDLALDGSDGRWQLVACLDRPHASDRLGPVPPDCSSTRPHHRT